jgi:hypothetical protein
MQTQELPSSSIRSAMSGKRWNLHVHDMASFLPLRGKKSRKKSDASAALKRRNWPLV